ncbi:MAG: sulfurtransferase [Gammaproteobacteria bacterium]|nr:sulfurtransferase [Gammaproteobacteria bacterium]
MVKEINSIELQNLLSSESGPYLLDIRSEAEVVHGMLPDSTHLPMHLIPVRMNDFPKDKEIVLYCRSGARSYHACMYLMQQGWQNVINLRGGIIDWARQGYQIVAYG